MADMVRFHKGDKLKHWQLNELAELVETLQSKVSQLERQLGAGEAGSRSTATPGAASYMSLRRAKGRQEPQEAEKDLWTPFYLDHRNGLVAPGTPGWYVRKGACSSPCWLEQQEFAKGTVAWLKVPVPMTEDSQKKKEPCLLFLPETCEPKDFYGEEPVCGCGGVDGFYHVRLGAFGPDCRFVNYATSSPPTARQTTFYKAARKGLRLRQVSAAWAPGSGPGAEEPVALYPECYCGCAEVLHLRPLIPSGGTRISVKNNNIYIAGGVVLECYCAPAVACATVNSCGLPEWPVPPTCNEVVPAGPTHVAPEWRELARLDLGAAQVGLHGLPWGPGRWHLRFAPGTVSLVPEWRRYSPADSSVALPKPGDYFCGGSWRTLWSVCKLARWAPATSSGWIAPDAVYDTRVLFARGRDEDTGAEVIWYIQEERCRLYYCTERACWTEKTFN